MKHIVLHPANLFPCRDPLCKIGPPHIHTRPGFVCNIADIINDQPPGVQTMPPTPPCGGLTAPPRTPKRHSLKTWPEFFRPMWDGIKPFDVRKDDRDFQPGDVVVLEEYEPPHRGFERDGKLVTGYLGRGMEMKIAYVLRAEHLATGALAPGHVVLGLPDLVENAGKRNAKPVAAPSRLPIDDFLAAVRLQYTQDDKEYPHRSDNLFRLNLHFGGAVRAAGFSETESVCAQFSYLAVMAARMALQGDASLDTVRACRSVGTHPAMG